MSPRSRRPGAAAFPGIVDRKSEPARARSQRTQTSAWSTPPASHTGPELGPLNPIQVRYQAAPLPDAVPILRLFPPSSEHQPDRCPLEAEGLAQLRFQESSIGKVNQLGLVHKEHKRRRGRLRLRRIQDPSSAP